MTPEQLSVTYATPHDHRLYGRGHGERVDRTIKMINAYTSSSRPGTIGIVADLSCGNAEIARGVRADDGWAPSELHLGDIAPGYQYHGPVEDTVQHLDPVDLFIHAETLEHLDDPDLVLRAIRPVARHLALSTPIEAWGDTNGEHYWAWSRQDVEDMLAAVLFTPVDYDEVDSTAYGEPYRYGIWMCT